MKSVLLYGLPVLLLLALVAYLVMNGRTTARGVREGRLAPCPDSPNCISSQADPDDPEHYLPPLALTGSVDEARQQILAILGAMPRTRLITENSRYLHAVVSSRLWRFRDDVEFFLDEEAGLIHFRSAARMGYDDLDVNRQRMQSIRDQFAR